MAFSKISQNLQKFQHSKEIAGDICYIHRCAKIQFTFANIPFCTEKLPVEVTSVSSESHLSLRFMEPTRIVIYHNYTLLMCRRVYPNAFEIGKGGSWVSYAEQLELIPTPYRIRVTGKNMQLLDHTI